MATFEDLGLSPSTVQAVADTGYTQPTPIQEQAIPVALAGRDVLGIAQTGTGKTAAFTLPMIDRLSAGRAKALMPRSLVIAPTRELADQVAASFEKYAKGTRLNWALLIGGVSFGDQERKLSSGVDVLIATPGRLLDFYDRRKLMLLDVKTLVVDEADRMLDMGFIPDLERIFEITPKQKQTLFFSATMPPEITRLTTQFLKDPTRIEVARPATTNENIKQYVVKLPMSEPKAKRMALRALIERGSPDSGIIFCNRKSEVDIVAKSLQKYGFDAAPIHGDLDQSTRMKTLEAFRAGELKLLVASDVAARGLDIPAVSHVFNYDVPHHADDYVHRIGRTGRAGRSGEAFMIVTPLDDRGYDKVLKLTKDEPEAVELELDWEEARRGAERDRERYGGRGGRERGGRERSGRGRERDRERDRPVPDHGQRAAMEPIAAPEPAPEREPPSADAAPAVRERGERPERVGRPERPERDRSERPERDRPRREERPAPRQADDNRTRRDRDDRAPRRERPERGDDVGPRVVGFGSDVPAFLLRSALPSLEAAAARAPEEDEDVLPPGSGEVEVVDTPEEVEDAGGAEPSAPDEAEFDADAPAPSAEETPSVAEVVADAESEAVAAKPKRARRTPTAPRRRKAQADAPSAMDAGAGEVEPVAEPRDAASADGSAEAPAKPVRKRAPRRKPAEAAAGEAETAAEVQAEPSRPAEGDAPTPAEG